MSLDLVLEAWGDFSREPWILINLGLLMPIKVCIYMVCPERALKTHSAYLEASILFVCTVHTGGWTAKKPDSNIFTSKTVMKDLSTFMEQKIIYLKKKKKRERGRTIVKCTEQAMQSKEKKKNKILDCKRLLYMQVLHYSQVWRGKGMQKSLHSQVCTLTTLSSRRKD